MSEISEYIFARTKIDLELNEQVTIDNVNDLLIENLDTVCASLMKFKGRHFTISELEDELAFIYGRTLKTKLIANNIFQIIDPDNHVFNAKSDNNVVTFIEKNGTFRTKGVAIIRKIRIKSNFTQYSKGKFRKYMDPKVENAPVLQY